MALTDESNGGIGATMLVGPTGYPMMGNGGGFGNCFGGDWAWILLLLLIGGGGWGWGNCFGGGNAAADGAILYPWMNQAEITSDGFRDQMMNTNITSVRDGINDISTQLCNGFAGVNASINGAQSAISNQLYNNEIASLNRSFAEQTANTAGFNGVQSSLCDIRYGNANNTRDILTALTAGVQSIKDQLCQDKIDAKNDEIAQLRQEVLYTRGQAAAESIYQRGQNSQDVQTAQILAGQAAIPGQVYTRLSECPVSTVPVYGRQPIFQCNNGCGCGCGNGFAN